MMQYDSMNQIINRFDDGFSYIRHLVDKSLYNSNDITSTFTKSEMFLANVVENEWSIP